MKLTNLKSQMAIHEVKIEDIAKLLGIHRNSAANKVNGETAFSIEEAVKVRDKFFPEKTLEYLFEKREVEQAPVGGEG